MASLKGRLQSYHRRRIEIPVGADALVLDVGSGDKPHWRADVLLDRYLGNEFAAQRSGSRAASVSRPMFDADAADMPFADKAFDYVICSHVLEHVTDPAAVVAELCRVSRAGYIEVPEAASAKIVDFPSHLWWCELRDGVLTFTAKAEPYFDADIDAYLTASGMREPLAALLDSDLEHRVVSLQWKGSVPFAAHGSIDPAFAARAMAAEPHHRGGQAVASRALASATRFAYRSRLRREPVEFDDIVKPSLRRGNDESLTSTGLPSRHERRGFMIRSILSSDLPQLDTARLDEVTTFVEQRIAQLVGPAGTAVRIVRGVMTVLLASPWRSVTQPVLTTSALPALGDFVRLVRSLGYAYIWEHWPDTLPTGATR